MLRLVLCFSFWVFLMSIVFYVIYGAVLPNSNTLLSSKNEIWYISARLWKSDNFGKSFPRFLLIVFFLLLPLANRYNRHISARIGDLKLMGPKAFFFLSTQAILKVFIGKQEILKILKVTATQNTFQNGYSLHGEWMMLFFKCKQLFFQNGCSLQTEWDHRQRARL